MAPWPTQQPEPFPVNFPLALKSHGVMDSGPMVLTQINVKVERTTNLQSLLKPCDAERIARADSLKPGGRRLVYKRGRNVTEQSARANSLRCCESV